MPREYRQDLDGLIDVGGVERQQGIEIRCAIGLLKGVVHGRQQAAEENDPFLHPRGKPPEDKQDAAKCYRIEQAK